MLAWGIVLGCWTGAAAQQTPAEFTDLYNELYGDIATFRSRVDQSWNGVRHPVTFSANLLSANSELGPALLAPNYREAVSQELDGLKALGVTAVLLDIDFPMLYRPFHAPGEYDQFLSFYINTANDIRARGLKVIVKTSTIYTHTGYTNWNLIPFYASLTKNQYIYGRMDVARTLAVALRPDYLSVVQEPDTESGQAGQPDIGTVAGSTTMLNYIISGVRPVAPAAMKIGAGVGTWQMEYADYIDSFVATSIDFVDLHVYPVNREYLDRVIEIADTAQAAGKKVAMTETWLYKIRDTELGTLDPPTIFGRDVFSFWAPLDAFHLQTMATLAHFKKFEFMASAWSGFLRDYVDYDATTSTLTPAQLNTLAQSAQTDSILAGTYSMAGYAYMRSIVNPADLTPPSAPPDLTAHLRSATSLTLTWSPAPDNIGAAVYRVYRGPTQVAQTAATFFEDEGLLEGGHYVYAVFASDAAGNRSVAASVGITMPDATLPTVPRNMTVTPVISGSQINLQLSWLRSTDNVAVTQYRIYRGTSEADLSVIAASPTNTYTIVNAAASQRYVFAVSALDPTFNDSGRSQPVTITTPVIPDITAPVARVNYPTAGQTLSRTTYLYALVYDVRGGIYDVPSGPAGVQFQIDGVNVGAYQTVPDSSTPQYSVYKLQIDTRTLANGPRVIGAVARDRANNAVSAPTVAVTVVN